MASENEVKKLGALARIRIPEGKLASFAKEFDSILAYVGKLEELRIDVAKTPSAGQVRNVFREDGEPHESGKYTDALVEQFPDSEGNYLKVKQIITHD